MQSLGILVTATIVTCLMLLSHAVPASWKMGVFFLFFVLILVFVILQFRDRKSLTQNYNLHIALVVAVNLVIFSWFNDMACKKLSICLGF